MQRLIAVDWGTSSLRAALLDEDGMPLEEHASSDGILSVAPGGFAAVLRGACERWVTGGDGDRPLILMSGMVGSRQGWREAVYCPCPAGFGDVARNLAWIEGGAGAAGMERVAIVPGLSCEHGHIADQLHGRGVPDVMRGEETQVFGALGLLGIDSGLCVLPGTHSKWVRVRAGRIEGFHTYMTGEFYALLRRHSILARSLPDVEVDLDEEAFTQGVARARGGRSLLQTAFSVRTLALFERLPANALAAYLSGLVIGEELRAQALANRGEPVILIGAPELTLRYELALNGSGLASRRIGPEATWRGLWAVARQLEIRR